MSHTCWQDLIDELDGAKYRFGIITPTTPVYRVEFDAGLTDAEVRDGGAVRIPVPSRSPRIPSDGAPAGPAVPRLAVGGRRGAPGMT
jgi:hypothetical protein